MKRRYLKKAAVILLTAGMAFSLAACGDGGKQQASGTEREEQAVAENALEILNVVWDSYGEDEKFAAAGGDMSEENMNPEGPGRYSTEDADALDSALGFPAAFADLIDDAASVMHMMNANTFTCGVYHVKKAEDVEKAASAIKDNILKRQWLCGFPDRLVIASAGDYVISFFGENEIMDTFQKKLTDAYPSAKILAEEPIA